MTEPTPNIDRLLELLRAGDESARRELFARLYAELKSIAKRQIGKLEAGHSLQPTDLLHEAWLRIGSASPGDELGYTSQFHFCCAAAKAMRSVLVDHARNRGAEKRGGGKRPLSLDQTGALSNREIPTAGSIELLPLDLALEKLCATDAELGELIELRYFAGLQNEQIAKLRGLSLATIERRFAVARAFLHRELKESDGRRST